MPAFWIGYTPLIERQHQLGMDNIQKLSESLTCISAPLPETSALTMPDDEAIEAIHEENHMPMTADRLVTTHLILVEFLVESLKHGVSDGCQEIHWSLLGRTLYPFIPIIPDSTSNFTNHFDKAKIVILKANTEVK